MQRTWCSLAPLFLFLSQTHACALARPARLQTCSCAPPLNPLLHRRPKAITTLAPDVYTSPLDRDGHGQGQSGGGGAPGAAQLSRPPLLSDTPLLSLVGHEGDVLDLSWSQVGMEGGGPWRWRGARGAGQAPREGGAGIGAPEPLHRMLPACPAVRCPAMAPPSPHACVRP